MVTLPGSPGPTPHHARQLAESYGEDPERYHRTRPRYPQGLVDRIVAATPGRDVLDVGIGTGISAEPFRDAGCRVVGVDVDERMAEFARRRGFEVEEARFEEWDPADRHFDTVVAGQTWHWVDPVAGATNAARVLRAGGRLAVFWNAMELPPAVRDAVVAGFRHAVPEAADSAANPGGGGGYAAFYDNAADGMRRAGGFSEPEQWQVDWEHPYSRDEWLELMPTGGGFNRLDPDRLAELQSRVGAAIDGLGGSFTMRYATVAVTARRVEPA